MTIILHYIDNDNIKQIISGKGSNLRQQEHKMISPMGKNEKVH
jgi:hypothetical protein